MSRDAAAVDDLRVELLGTQHDRDCFDRGVAPLNEYLKKRAHQDAKRGVAMPYVLVRRSAPGEILGFYTLSSTGVRLDDFPDSVVRKLPRYPLVPATLIGRLAVDVHHRGQGIGERLLVDALKRSADASRTVASVAVFVDAKDDTAARFYARYGFIPLSGNPHRLFIAMRTVARLWPNR